MAEAADAMASTLEAGWSALREGEWAQALSAFEESLARSESAEAHEGRSWAAWWLDRPQIVFDSRGRAYELYRARGDHAAAALMAAWLGCDHLDFNGAAAVAGGWLARARRLLEDAPAGPEQGWIAFFDGYLAHATGSAERASELAREAGELGRRLQNPDLQMLGLGLEGAALVAATRVEEGMRLLDEATATALEGGAEVPISGAWTCCFLVSACTTVGDYPRASQWCERIAEFAERYGSRYMLAFCRAEYGAVHTWRGEWSDAEELLSASVEDFARSRPAMSSGPLVKLAELRRRQGRTGEALALLERAGPGPEEQLCRARIAFDRRRPGRAAELADRLVRQISPYSRLTRAPALELAVQARTARGELERAAEALGELRDLANLAGTDALRATADLADGVLSLARGEREQARRLLEDAVDGFLRSGGRFDAARARAHLATGLHALGRSPEADREAEQAVAELRRLGAAAGADFSWMLDPASQRDEGGDSPQLTPRQREVLELVAEGLTNREIAERLVVSEHTVHRHVANILRVLNVPTRTAAVAQAARSGTLSSPAPGEARPA